MHGDEYILVAQKCTACGHVKQHAEHWWLFISNECYDCESKPEPSLVGWHPVEQGGEPF